MTSAKKNKIRLSLFVSFSLYTILSFVISAPHLSDFSSTIDAILYALSSYWLIKLTVVLAADILYTSRSRSVYRMSKLVTGSMAVNSLPATKKFLMFTKRCRLALNVNRVFW